MPIDPLALFVSIPTVLLTVTFVIVLRRATDEFPESFTVEELDESFDLYTRGTWVTTIALVVVFTATGFQLATSMFDPGVFSAVFGEFGRWGYSETFRQFVGASQILAALLLLVPRTAQWAAGYLALVMAGAFYTQIAAETYVLAAYPMFLLMALAFVAYERYLWHKSRSVEREEDTGLSTRGDQAPPEPLS